MTRFSLSILAVLLWTGCSRPAPQIVAPIQTTAPPPPPFVHPERLLAEFERASELAGGVMGISAVHVETAQRVSLHGTDRFPMASVYKIGIAVALLHQYDEGKVNLDEVVHLGSSDLRPGSGILTKRHRREGPLTLRVLLELSMQNSDNTATDFLMHRAGGPKAVTSYLVSKGIEGVSIDRSTLAMISDSVGMEAIEPDPKWNLDQFYASMRKVSPARQEQAARAFESDPRDTATADGLADLLARICRHEILRPSTDDLLLDIMGRSHTGQHRLRAILPAGTEVADKTGTIGRTTNDVGVITLPGNGGHVVVAALIRSSERDEGDRERAIAEVARAAHDYFLFARR